MVARIVLVSFEGYRRTWVRPDVLAGLTVWAVLVPEPLSYAALTAALAITVGLIALAAGLMRLGFLAALISEPELKGFIIGLALTTLVGQVRDVLHTATAEGEPPLFETVEQAIQNLAH